MRSFLLVKTQPGTEKDVFDRFQTLEYIREVHLIAGEFDLLVAMESQETEIDPRRKVVEVVVDKIRKLGGIVDTRTIIPIDSRLRTTPFSTRPNVKAFVFIQSDAGREKEIMNKLWGLPEVCGVHLLFGKADVLAELEVEKTFVHPPPQHVANVVESKISRISGVRDTSTFVPLESKLKS